MLKKKIELHGKKGTAITFCSDYEVERLKYVEKFYSTQIEELPSNVGDIIS